MFKSRIENVNLVLLEVNRPAVEYAAYNTVWNQVFIV